jgi:hypothetical protein
MIAYLTQEKNPENENLPSDCPWTSWIHIDGQPLPENAIVATDEEYALIYAEFEPMILKEKDRIAMSKRAAVKDSLIGQIGAENKERIRNGIWTTQQLIEFLNSEESKKLMNEISGLSFELAQGSVMAITNPIVTLEIKLQWVNRLKEHLYL